MINFLLKLAAFALICALSVGAAVYFTDGYVAQTAEKQKTLSDALVESRLQAAMKEAEDKARAELEAQNVTIVTERLETKPPFTTAAATAATEASATEIPTETQTETETPAVTENTPTTPERVTEYKRGGLLDDRQNAKIRTILTLSEEEYAQMMDFLIEHYFLNGYQYAREETDPELKAKKQLAAEMEGCVSESLDLVLAFLDISEPMALLDADYNTMLGNAKALKADFAEKYADAHEYGAEFADIYQSGLKYFDRLIEAFAAVKKTADDYKSASNPLFALGIIAGAIDDVLLPELIGTIESSFDITEACQEVFLEGTQGAHLLTRDEVTQIILNPGLVL